MKRRNIMDCFRGNQNRKEKEKAWIALLAPLGERKAPPGLGLGPHLHSSVPNLVNTSLPLRHKAFKNRAIEFIQISIPHPRSSWRLWKHLQPGFKRRGISGPQVVLVECGLLPLPDGPRGCFKWHVPVVLSIRNVGGCQEEGLFPSGGRKDKSQKEST